MHTIVDPARLDRMFVALADVHRRGMLDRLSRGPASVSELAEPLGVTLPSAVKHLAVLEQGGFVVSQKVGRVRTYKIEPKALDAMAAWVARRKTLLNAQFARLDAYLAQQNRRCSDIDQTHFGCPTLEATGGSSSRISGTSRCP